MPDLGALNGLDWLLISITTYCIARGIWRGAISQLLGILGVIAAFYVSFHYWELLAQRLSSSFPGVPRPGLIAMVLLFFLTWISLSIAGSWLAQLVHKTALSILDRVLGGLVGLGKAIIIASILISSLLFFFSPKNSIIGDSVFAPYVQQTTGLIIKITPSRVQKQFRKKRDEFIRYWNSSGR